MSVTKPSLVQNHLHSIQDAKIAAIREAGKTENYFPTAFIKAAAIAVAQEQSPAFQK